MAKFCADCKWCDTDTADGGWYCKHEQALHIVFKEAHIDCEAFRQGECGLEGKLWESKRKKGKK